MSKPPSDFPITILDEGCPEGYICLRNDSAAMTGLYFRDAERTFSDLRACPNVHVDETMYTALDAWIKEQQAR